ncbi:hypothetical protein [Sphingobacterium yanglingense]|uniref:Lipocalin-like protein n=1 Tax=Sphingobacterium yanglingense TaxID=1437280 RepID=A0A4R6W9N9_9SPHI|nr:hypothetical protein [Sphingobacterium yanglingense]TDQ73919.1 hypothetical protein CLV99_4357 [Sphingobacterium yanglingense]
MKYNLLFPILGVFFLTSAIAIDTQGMNSDEAITQTANTQTLKIDGKWKLLEKSEKSLLHGERRHNRETYKKPVIYDFTTPKKLKISRNGELEVYDYVLKNNIITIYWDVYMKEPEGIEYTVKINNGKLNLQYEEKPAAKPNFFTIDYNLEAI